MKLRVCGPDGCNSEDGGRGRPPESLPAPDSGSKAPEEGRPCLQGKQWGGDRGKGLVFAVLGTVSNDLFLGREKKAAYVEQQMFHQPTN